MPTERVTPEHRVFAQQLRTQLTDCERLLWRRLRNRGLASIKFRRQHPFPPYVLDFYCAELRLVIELDGGQHYDDTGQEKDRVRTDYLQHKGLDVLRFSNSDVLQNLEGVLAEILRWVEACSPHPNPLPKGERELD
ncbi:endonuclease domain-containing protein [Pseudomonas sp. MTM4]|uniref:endonuclease domain-containing protein n=1 Tax=unclassified Pseudomonas TaxID=196821 RepID=UPI0018D25EE3|nr:MULTISPECIES: endonuclease domain-containing protein [unclassified Pseudomonas]MBC8651094.1 endonuclease domain-containing protein [Pseudomonas sp. MT4]QXY93315.1 endonuclease domain-containing protein [Pseudomonas sp. MTM4]